MSPSTTANSLYCSMASVVTAPYFKSICYLWHQLVVHGISKHSWIELEGEGRRFSRTGHRLYSSSGYDEIAVIEIPLVIVSLCLRSVHADVRVFGKPGGSVSYSSSLLQRT